jgi:hypothetical protein
MAQIFEQQDSPALAEALLKPIAPSSFEARKRLLRMYQERIEAAWTGLGSRLSMDASGIFTLNFLNREQVTNLAVLQDMPLTTLILSGCRGVRDLKPLRGMPLTKLDLVNCVLITDLTPLQGMPLTFLDLSNCNQVSDLTPLRDMKLTYLSLYYCHKIHHITPLRGMPLTSLRLEECGATDLTPLQGMSLTDLSLNQRPVYEAGLNFVRQMKSLKVIDIGYGRRLTPEAFWKKYDAGEFSK